MNRFRHEERYRYSSFSKSDLIFWNKRCHFGPNLHVLKSWISSERNKILKNQEHRASLFRDQITACDMIEINRYVKYDLMINFINSFHRNIYKTSCRTLMSSLWRSICECEDIVSLFQHNPRVLTKAASAVCHCVVIPGIQKRVL
jgi:hypothetical protein